MFVFNATDSTDAIQLLQFLLYANVTSNEGKDAFSNNVTKIERREKVII